MDGVVAVGGIEEDLGGIDGGLGGRGTSDCLLGLCCLTALTIATSRYMVGSKLGLFCPGHAHVVVVVVVVAIEQSPFNACPAVLAILLRDDFDVPPLPLGRFIERFSLSQVRPALLAKFLIIARSTVGLFVTSGLDNIRRARLLLTTDLNDLGFVLSLCILASLLGPASNRSSFCCLALRS